MFTVLAVLALGSAGVVAFSKNIVHSALALLGTFLGVAGLYITLSADFLAATQILVYVGGTLTLILFAVMLTAKIEDMKLSNPSQQLLVGLGLVTVVLLVLGKVAATTDWALDERPVVPSTAKL
ncbi:MAG: NADH-quinone oxidoreductase subunit J, partial [Polyangiaceae bacterium]